MVPVDPDRLRPKIQHVRDRLERLRKVRAAGREAFLDEELMQDAAVRNLQTSVEALLDMANHIAARGGLGTRTRYRDAIDLLIEHRILPEEKTDAYRAMVRFRNRAVHLYDEIDAHEIWAVLEGGLADFETFIGAVVERYFEG